MTSSKIEMPGEVKADPAALMASLHLLPSPTPNLEIKYTKVSAWRGPAVHGDFLESSLLPLHDLLGSEGGVTASGAGGQRVIAAQQRGHPVLGFRASEVLPGSRDTSATHRKQKCGADPQRLVPQTVSAAAFRSYSWDPDHGGKALPPP